MSDLNFGLVRQHAHQYHYFINFSKLATLAATGMRFHVKAVGAGIGVERGMALHVAERDILLAHQWAYNEFSQPRQEVDIFVACSPHWGSYRFHSYLPEEDRLDRRATQAELLIFHHCLNLVLENCQKPGDVVGELQKIFIRGLPSQIPVLVALNCGAWPHHLDYSADEITFDRISVSKLYR